MLRLSACLAFGLGLALTASAAQAPAGAAPARGAARAGAPAQPAYRANVPVTVTRFPQCIPLAAQWQEWSGRILPRVHYSAKPVAEALDGLSPSYPQPPTPAQPTYYLLILDPDGVLKAADPKVTLELRNARFPDVVDQICAQAGLVWWLDRDVYVTPKASLDKAFAPWREAQQAAAPAPAASRP